MKTGAILCGLLGASSAATGHDFWIEPATFHAHTGESVSIALCEGEPFDGRLFPRNAARIAQFVATGPAGEQPIVGRDGRELAGVARFTRPGVYVLGYRSSPSVTEMEARKFEQYLLEEGLEHIVELRRARGMTHEGVREAYSRYSKSLLRVGDVQEPSPQPSPASGRGSGDVADAQPLGFRLELVPEFRLDDAANRTEYSFRLLFGGKPLPGVLVKATPRSEPDLTLKARTDADGQVRYSLRHAGEWLLTTVHMVEAAPGTSAQWESFWGSLTFELPAERHTASAPRTTRSACTSSAS